MLLKINKKHQKVIPCPKCGSATEISGVVSLDVHKCPVGCGIWINQSELDASRNLKSLQPSKVADQATGFWRSRMFMR